MRFSTVTILAFIAYTGNQVMAAPLPGFSQSLEAHEPRHGSYNDVHERHGHAKHVYAHIISQGDEESAKQIGEPEGAESGHPYHTGGYSRHHLHPAQGSESPDVPETQDIQPRSPGNNHHTNIMVNKRSFQKIEARSPGGTPYRGRESGNSFARSAASWALGKAQNWVNKNLRRELDELD